MSEIKHIMQLPGHPSFGFIDISLRWKGQNVTRGGRSLALGSTRSQEMINGWPASTSSQSLTRTKVLVTGERRPESGASLNINTPAPPQRRVSYWPFRQRDLRIRVPLIQRRWGVDIVLLSETQAVKPGRRADQLQLIPLMDSIAL